MLQQIILVLNVLISLGSVVFALVAVARPGFMINAPSDQTHDRFYPIMYAIRAVPLGLLAAVAPWLSGSAAPTILIAAAAAQIGDAGLGLQRRTWGMVISPLMGAAIYIAMALMLLNKLPA